MSDSTRGDALVRLGAVVFGVGALATVVTVTPLLVGADPPPGPGGPGWYPQPTAAYALSMLMAAGFALAAAGLLLSVREQRRALRPLRPPRGGPPASPGTR